MSSVDFSRMATALLACLLGAAGLIHVLFHGPTEIFNLSLLGASLARVLIYAAPLAVLTSVAVEHLRLRQLWVQVALAVAMTFVAAVLAVRTETISSPAFAHGPWAAIALLLVAALSGLAYWSIAGRRAGWRGDAVEEADAAAIKAFEVASAGADPDRCIPCLAIWSGLALAAFLLFGLGSLALTGLHRKLIAEAEAQGNLALRSAGHDWALFKITDDRGVLVGLAPTQAHVVAAFDDVSRALASVTGFPGVIAGIDSIATLGQPVVPKPQAAPSNRAPRPADPAVAVAGFAQKETTSQSSTFAMLAETPHVGDYVTKPVDATRGGEAAAAKRAPAQTATLDDTGDFPSPVEEPKRTAEPPPCNTDHVAIIQTSFILFERQRFDIGPTYDGALQRLAATARACAPWPLIISGHADSHGDSLFNEQISSLRAIAVRENLIARGVSPELLVAKPADHVLQMKSTNAESALNRRVEFRLVEPSRISRDATQDPGARAQNCERDLSVIMSRSIIHFAIGSARVSEEGMGVINELAAAIRKCGSVIITVEGHTDNIGSRDKNQVLSDRRAGSVRDLLIAAGVDPTRIMSRGYASTQPYDTAETAEAYALNRRIEFKVSGKFTSENTGGP